MKIEISLMTRIGLLLLAIALAAPVAAQTNEAVPAETEGIDVNEKLENQVPLDLIFKNEAGEPVQLGDYFKGEKPVILTLNYYGCPMLCGLVLNGMAEGLQELELSPSKDFDIVTISIDHLETPELATAKKKSYVEYFDREGAENGWHFLVGNKANIKQVAESVGYQYKYLPEQDEYAHPSVIMALTPSGKISRYLYGVQYEPKTLRLALIEASEGKIGSTVDHFILTCFQYDPSVGKYTVSAMRVMRLAGVVTLLALGLALGIFWKRERSHARELDFEKGAGANGAENETPGQEPASAEKREE